MEQIAVRYEDLAEEVDPVRETLSKCVEQLKGRSKRVIELRYRRGMKSSRIAEEMTLSAGAVRMLLCRVRKSCAAASSGVPADTSVSHPPGKQTRTDREGQVFHG